MKPIEDLEKKTQGGGLELQKPIKKPLAKSHCKEEYFQRGNMFGETAIENHWLQLSSRG